MWQHASCLLRYRPYSLFHSQPNTNNTNCSKLNIPYNNLLAQWVGAFVCTFWEKQMMWLKGVKFQNNRFPLSYCCKPGYPGLLLPEQSSFHQRNDNQLRQTRTLMVVIVLYSKSNVDLMNLSTWYPSSPGSPRSPCAPGGPCVDTNASTWTHIL